MDGEDDARDLDGNEFPIENLVRVVDDQTINPNDMTNAEIDRRALLNIEHPMITLIYQFFIEICHQQDYHVSHLNINLIITMNVFLLPPFLNQITAVLRPSQVEPPPVAHHHFIDFDRDAQAEEPTDDDLRLSDTTTRTLLEQEQIGIQNTEEHDERIFAGVTTNRNTYFIINNEVNGHVNEDATLYDHRDPDVTEPVTNALVNINEDETGQAAVDESTVNTNSLESIESHENVKISDDNISTIDTIDEDHITDDKQLEGPTGSSTINTVDNTEDSDHSTQTYFVNEPLQNNTSVCENQHVLLNGVINGNAEIASNDVSQFIDVNSRNTTDVIDHMENNVEAEETEQHFTTDTDNAVQIEQIADTRPTHIEQKQSNENQRNSTPSEQNKT